MRGLGVYLRRLHTVSTVTSCLFARARMPCVRAWPRPCAELWNKALMAKASDTTWYKAGYKVAAPSHGSAEAEGEERGDSTKS